MQKTKILILSDSKKISRNFNDFFPIYKWRKDLYLFGFDIKIFSSFNYLLKFKGDGVILSSRYFTGCSKDDILNAISRLKQSYSKIIWFDVVDTSGSDSFFVLPYVHKFVKKQILKNKIDYTFNNFDLSLRPWLIKMPEIQRYTNYTPAGIDYLNKINVAWNIGLCDYRHFFGFSSYLRNFIITPLEKSEINFGNKNIFTTFRGSTHYLNEEVSYQRNKVLQVLNEMQIPSIITGAKVKKKHYLNELSKSKVSISPFGWGEICYRDFEIMNSMTLLVKPSMNHIYTFPEFFVPNETYIEVDWYLNDLENKLINIHYNYDFFKNISVNAYNKFMFYQNNSIEFVVQFNKIINE